MYAPQWSLPFLLNMIVTTPRAFPLIVVVGTLVALFIGWQFNRWIAVTLLCFTLVVTYGAFFMSLPQDNVDAQFIVDRVSPILWIYPVAAYATGALTRKLFYHRVA